MGRKGDSKRKTAKPKNVTGAGNAVPGTVASIARVSDAPLPHATAKVSTNTTNKKGKKK